MESIKSRYKEIKKSIPDHVIIVAAVKTRTVEEIKEAIDVGIEIMGENYVQEAQKKIDVLGHPGQWHMIGHLQRNKVKNAVQLFDMIETLDSWRLAEAIDRRCAAIDKTMPVLVEINSGREVNKTGVLPEEADDLIRRLASLQNISVQGLMTMGPAFGNPDDARPFFSETKKAFDRITAARIPNVEMRYLSMGMSNSYEIAIEEGSNMIRLGTRLFGSRDSGN